MRSDKPVIVLRARTKDVTHQGYEIAMKVQSVRTYSAAATAVDHELDSRIVTFVLSFLVHLVGDVLFYLANRD